MKTARDIALKLLEDSRDREVEKKPRAWRPTRVPRSTKSHGRLLDIYNSASKYHDVEVPHDKLRATQSWVHKKYDGGHEGHSSYGPAYGVRDHEGNVHVLDGHHRADHAYGEKSSLKMRVVDHS